MAPGIRLYRRSGQMVHWPWSRSCVGSMAQTSFSRAQSQPQPSDHFMPCDTLYHLLGCDPSATTSEIKTAFRKLARRFHPDVCKQQGSQQKFKAMSQAYEVLCDAERRRQYDAHGMRGLNSTQYSHLHAYFGTCECVNLIIRNKIQTMAVFIHPSFSVDKSQS